MEQFGSVKCNTIHEDLSVERGAHQLIHEHYFVPARLKGPNHFAIRCITCGYCYCNICGKLKVITH